MSTVAEALRAAADQAGAQLKGVWAMDAKTTEGIDQLIAGGAEVDQAEIDRLWDALSHVPEAEACGWLKDRFGISWQVLPENMGELMTRPGAHEHMMAMRKIIIDEL